MQTEDNEVYVEWLAAAPKGVRWDKAQEMYALYQERRRKQAEEVAARLLGKNPDRELDTLLGCRESYRIAEGLLQKGWTYRRGEK